MSISQLTIFKDFSSIDMSFFMMFSIDHLKIFIITNFCLQ